MAERVLVSTEDMLSAIQKYTASKQQQQSAYTGMRSIVNETESYFQGEAAEAFRSSFNTMYSKIEQSEAVMEDAINELKAVDQSFQEASSAIQSHAGTLDTSTGIYG